MGTMVPLPGVAAGTPVQAVDASGGIVAALCGDEVFTGSPRDPDSWAPLCPGAIDVAVRGDRLFTARDGEVVAVDVATGRQVGRVGPSDETLRGFAVSADGRRVALGQYRTPSVWNVESGRRVARWRAHSGSIQHLGFSPDGRRLATCRPDGLRIWRWRSPLRIAWRARGRFRSTPVFLPDGRLLVGVKGKALGVYSRRGRLERTLEAEEYVWDAAVAPAGDRVAARQSEGLIAVWSWPDGGRLLSDSAERMAGGVAFDGDVLVTGDDAALMTWGEGIPAPAPERFVPHFDRIFEGSAPPSSLDWERLTVEAVEAAARAIPWLERLGAPTEFDAERIGDWDGWHGPEDRATAAYDARLLALRVAVKRAVRGLERPEVIERMEAVGAIVHERASAAVPYDPDEDPWHAPTNATWSAEYVAETLTGYAVFGWPVPADLRAIWCWFEAGHWPCALAGGRLVVY